MIVIMMMVVMALQRCRLHVKGGRMGVAQVDALCVSSCQNRSFGEMWVDFQLDKGALTKWRGGA